LLISLLTDVKALDEIVVTALGISRDKKTLGYAVQQVAGDEINNAKNSNFISSLSGRISGLNVKNSTNFGGSNNVIIRGSTSLTQSNQALFVVDGVPIDNTNVNHAYQTNGRIGFDYGNAASDVNPNDIESVSVLKGAAATALYGSRAGSGVILITTKKGQNAKPVVRVSSNVTFSKVDKSTLPVYQQEYGPGYGLSGYGVDGEALDLEDIDGDGIDDLLVPYYDDASVGSKLDGRMVYQWDAFYPSSSNYMKKTPFVASPNGIETFFTTGVSLTNSVDISGGSDNSTYRFGYTNVDQTGTIPNQHLARHNATFAGSLDIYKNLTISSSANYVNTSAKGRPGTGYNNNIMTMFRQWYQVNVDVLQMKKIYEAEKVNATWNRSWWDDESPAYWDNPYWTQYENYETDERSRFIGYAKLDWKINDYLSAMGRYAVDTYSYLNEERKAVGSHAESFGVDQPDAPSGYSRLDRRFTETNFDLMLNFHKRLHDDLDLSAMLGSNVRRTRTDQVYASTNNGLAVPGVYALSNSADAMLPPEETYTRIGVNGIFGSFSLGYKNTYYLEGTLRRDQASTLPTKNNTYWYPSITGSWIFSNLIDSDLLSFGKLRLNYAEVGNSAPALSLSDPYTVLSSFSGNILVTVPDTKNNPELKPERQRAIEGGIEMNFLNNRLGFDVAVYQNTTFDQLVPISLSFATGYNRRYINAGEIENKGAEISVFGTPVKTRDFSWDIRVNWSANRNKVIKLYVDEYGNEMDNLQLASLQGGVTINARVGEPYGTIQGTDFVYLNGEKVVRTNGRYQISAENDKVLGNVNPDWLGGITNTFSYKGLSLSFLIDVRSGGSVFSLDQYYGQATGIYENSGGLNDLGNPLRDPVVWADPNDHSKGYASNSGGNVWPGVQADGSVNTVRVNRSAWGNDGYGAFPNAHFVYDASYVKLRELSLTYNLPAALLAQTKAFTAASLTFVGSNLWIIHKNLPYADPEAGQSSGNIQGWQSGVAPTEKNFGFTLNLQF
jgi:TonB-linked SusC/RagA family outer membrane protein